MKRALLLVVLLLCCSTAAAAEPLKLFVATNGNDQWSGTLAEPNAAKTDGPLATLQGARDALRRQKAAGKLQGPAAVQVRGGTYYLPQTLELTPEDSGTEPAPIVYEAFPGEKPVASGGVVIRGWKVTPEGRWQVQLPEVAAGKWNFLQLFVNGERRLRPRLPKKAYSFIEGRVPPSGKHKGENPDRFRYREGDIRTDWANPADIDVLCFSYWSMERMKIDAIDPDRRILTLKQPTWSWQHARLAPNERYIVENVREALSEPGEWYLDRPTGTLTYLPLPNERPETAVVVAPRLDRLVELKGDPAKKAWVEHIVFRGLTFQQNNWNVGPTGYQFCQAEAILDAAIDAVGARRCVLDQCRVTQTGDYAIQWGAGCQENQVTHCVLSDLGAGGVKLGELTTTKPERLARGNIVAHNRIVQGGRLHPAAVGVFIGDSPDNQVAHNEISDFYYTGISLGWNWGFTPSNAHHNRIEYNHIHGIGQRVLSDMGGIYTLGVSPGTVLRNNLIHDVVNDLYGGWGVYLDAGTSEVLVENNVAYRCQTGGFYMNFGHNDRLVNNIFALGKTPQLGRGMLSDAESVSCHFDRNIVYWREGILWGPIKPGEQMTLDHNLYWDASGRPVKFAGLSLAEWQAKGRDVHSLVADPRFENPDQGDFRLKPDSPALKLGFKPIDLSQVGPQGPAAKEATPPLPRAFPEPGLPPPLAVDDDFEDLKPGEKPMDAQVFEEADKKALIRVTADTAASGKHCLKFVDQPGLKQSFNPHLTYQPSFAQGTAYAHFDLRLEPGAVLQHEWRDWPSGEANRPGPSLWIDRDGTLKVAGKPLAKLPHSQWVRLEITCGLGRQRTGTWDLTVRLPDRRQPLRFTGLPCAPNFEKVDWVGFVAQGTETAVFYLDNLRLEIRTTEK
jgi:hypothetical protein